MDTGAWELVVHELAQSAGIDVPIAQKKRYGSKHHTFLSRRFDRRKDGSRLHFASAMTLLGKLDGEHGSYLDLVAFLSQSGSNTTEDLKQLWRRIVFFICVSNTDDHLRNHGFLLRDTGWKLAPSYDMNPNRYGNGLHLNISETDNAQDLDLALEVAAYFRVRDPLEVIQDVVEIVQDWRDVATQHGVSASAQESMTWAFRIADGWKDKQ